MFATAFNGCETDGDVRAVVQIELGFCQNHIVGDKRDADRKIARPDLDPPAIPASGNDDVSDRSFEIVDDPSERPDRFPEPIVLTVWTRQLPHQFDFDRTLLEQLLRSKIDGSD